MQPMSAAVVSCFALLSVGLTGWTVRAEENRWYVYRDADFRDNHGHWTNVMPEEGAKMMKRNMAEKAKPHDGASCIRIDIQLKRPHWCGVAVASQPDYWGKQEKKPAFDLRAAKKLVFHARGARGGECIQVQAAITGREEFGDSAKLPAETQWLALTKDWQKYELDVTGCDLSRVVTPFVVLTNKDYNTHNFTFYLDEIYYVLGDGRAPDGGLRKGDDTGAGPALVSEYFNNTARLRANPGFRCDPYDFFPMVVGSKWKYSIELGAVGPLGYEEIIQVTGGKAAVHPTRRVLLTEQKPKAGAGKPLALELHVRRPAIYDQFHPRFRVIELSVERDDLGIFRGSKKVFSTVIRHQMHQSAEFIVVFPPDQGPGSVAKPAPKESLDGVSRRLAFFAGSEAASLGVGLRKVDELYLVGPEKLTLDKRELECLRFKRVVAPAPRRGNEDQSPADAGFTENIWYARDVGLVRLEQKIGAKTSMIWKLESYALPGE